MPRAARRQLHELEARAAAGPVDSRQPDLFTQIPMAPPEPETHPAIERLAAIDPDELTPKQALEALYELKRLAS